MPKIDRPSDKPSGPKALRDAAQDVAVAALSFIAADGERLVTFLGETGLTPASLRAAAGKPDFNAGVLSFLIAHEDMLVAFSAQHGFDPKHVVSALAILEPPADPDAPVRRPM